MNIRNLYKKFMSYLKCPLHCRRQREDKPFDNPLTSFKREIEVELLNQLEASDKPVGSILMRYKDLLLEGSRMSIVVLDLINDIHLTDKALKLNIDNRSDRQRIYIKIASIIEKTLEKHTEFSEHPLYEVLKKRLEKIKALQEGYKIIDERKETDD